MKTTVSVQEMDELQIRPHEEIAEWRRLVAAGIDERWRDRAGWNTVSCPCCADEAATPAFSRGSVAYSECRSCGTLFAPQRPDEAALRSWFRDSDASRYWRDTLLAATGANRRESIVLPRAQWILDGVAEYVPKAKKLVDVSANGRPLVDEVLAGAPTLEAVLAGAAADLESQSRGPISVAPTAVADLATLGPAQLVTAIDAFDRAANLRALVAAVHATLEPGGVLFATLPVASGFEVQALWHRSPSVFPPDRMNLPTVNGLVRLFAGPSWELLELSTPGVLDVEMVRRAIEQAPDVEWPRALRALVPAANTSGHEQFIEYLQARRLTSFARLVARRRL